MLGWQLLGRAARLLRGLRRFSRLHDDEGDADADGTRGHQREGADPLATPPPTPPPALVRQLHDAVARGATVASACTGAFVLAAAGLLDGRRATTHWWHAPLLARLYPQLTVDANQLYIEDGPIITSAGSSAAAIDQRDGAVVAVSAGRGVAVQLG